MTILSDCYDYHGNLGWSIIPIREKDKRPYFSWKKYQEEQASPNRYNEWIKKYRNANAAVITGFVSGIVVLDIDDEEVAERLFINHGTPATPVSVTPKGYHWYFKYPGYHTPNASNKELCVDFRGDGGYIIVPPSIGSNDVAYEWVQSPYDLPVTAMPDWIFELFPNLRRE